MTPTHADLDAWTDGPDAPVALHLRQTLMPVEGHGAPIFPATYAGIGYQIDTLGDGTKIASIDSVGAQANRIEPIFADAPYRALVPQIDIAYGNEKSLSIFQAGHRLGDAVVRCTALAGPAKAAFTAFLDRNDATELAKLAPTSLVFGVWDSRDTQAKLPRLVQSVIRAWDVSAIKRSAQYFPPIDHKAEKTFDEKELEKAEDDARLGKKNDLAVRGYVAVPAVESPGGVIARGEIRRDVTLNLVALRKLSGPDATALRCYLLGLALVAVTAPLDGYLRSGCLLVPDADVPPAFHLVQRSGERVAVDLTAAQALAYAQTAAARFGVGPGHQLRFDKSLAKADAAAGKDKKAKA